MLSELLKYLQQNTSLAMLPAWSEDLMYMSSEDSDHLQRTATSAMMETYKLLTNALPRVFSKSIALSQAPNENTRVTFDVLNGCVEDYTDMIKTTFIARGQPIVDYMVASIRNQVTDFEMTVNCFILTYTTVGPLLNLIRTGQSIELALSVLECLPSHDNENGPIYCPVLPPGPIELYDLVATRRGFTVGQRVTEIVSRYDCLVAQSGNKEMSLYWEALKNLPGNKKVLGSLGYENNCR
jgi:hypothetical protein